MRSAEHFIETGKPLTCPDPLPESLKKNAGVFVSIKKQGSLRGCIGTITPKYKNLAEEVIQNALLAASQDPRFNPIQQRELPSLTFSVDVLTPLEKIENLQGHNIKQLGLLVQGEGKQGVLLPDLENIKSAEQQLKVCLKKGGFNSLDTYEIFRFEVKRFI
jgi:AmmeMemoRadiSam system protein A